MEALEIYPINKTILSETLEVRWDECSNFDENFLLFSSELHKLFDSCCPIRTKVVSNNRLLKPWLTPDVIILIQRKYYLYKRVKQNAIPFSVYRAYCNTLEKKVNKAKVVYLKNKFQTYTNNIRSTWKLTNIILGKIKK